MELKRTVIENKIVSIVIINFNSGNYIIKCLEHIALQSYKYIQVIIVDNNSTDGSSELLKSNPMSFKQYVYKRFDTNLGSSKANNWGISNSSGSFILILNADVFLNEKYIELCILEMTGDSKNGTIIGKILSTGNNRIIDTAGIEIFKEGIGAEIGMGEYDRGQHDSKKTIAGVCCCAAMYRREMLEDIKYEDEYYDNDYFAFIEDTDLSLRSTLAGWSTIYLPTAIAKHVRGGSTSSISNYVKYLSVRNSDFLYIKIFEGHLDPISQLLRYLYVKIRNYQMGDNTRIKLNADIKKYSSKIQKKRITLNIDKHRYNETIGKYVKRSYFVYRLNKYAQNIQYFVSKQK